MRVPFGIDAELINVGSLVVGLGAVGMLAFWVFDELEDAADKADLVERVGGRAETVTGGVVGGFGSLVVVVISIFMTIGSELARTGGELAPLIQAAPAVAGEVVIGLLAMASMAGHVPLKPWQMGVIVFALIGLTITLKYEMGDD